MGRKWIRANKLECTGCRMCELACSFEHDKAEINPKLSRIQVKKNDMEGVDFPQTCKQCSKALCAEACSVNAITFDDNIGAWIVDEEVCTGCGLCVEACPFGSIYVHPDSRTAVKCDLCKGNEPTCIGTCPTGAIKLEGKDVQ